MAQFAIGLVEFVRALVHTRLEFGFAIEIDAAETHAAVRRARQKGHVDAIAAVQTNAREADAAPQSLLLCHAGIKQTRQFLGKRRTDGRSRERRRLAGSILFDF